METIVRDPHTGEEATGALKRIRLPIWFDSCDPDERVEKTPALRAGMKWAN